MQIWRDKRGTEWPIHLTYGRLRMLRAVCPDMVQLFEQLEMGQADPLELADKLSAVALASLQWTDQKIGDDEFSEVLEGGGLLTLLEKIGTELSDFFQRQGLTEAVAAPPMTIPAKQA